MPGIILYFLRAEILGLFSLFSRVDFPVHGSVIVSHFNGEDAFGSVDYSIGVFGLVADVLQRLNFRNYFLVASQEIILAAIAVPLE